MDKVCSACGAQVPANGSECPNCGAVIAKEMNGPSFHHEENDTQAVIRNLIQVGDEMAGEGDFAGSLRVYKHALRLAKHLSPLSQELQDRTWRVKSKFLTVEQEQKLRKQRLLILHLLRRRASPLHEPNVKLSESASSVESKTVEKTPLQARAAKTPSLSDRYRIKWLPAYLIGCVLAIVFSGAMLSAPQGMLWACITFGVTVYWSINTGRGCFFFFVWVLGFLTINYEFFNEEKILSLLSEALILNLMTYWGSRVTAGAKVLILGLAGLGLWFIYLLIGYSLLYDLWQISPFFIVILMLMYLWIQNRKDTFFYRKFSNWCE